MTLNKEAMCKVYYVTTVKSIMSIDAWLSHGFISEKRGNLVVNIIKTHSVWYYY